MDCYLMKNGKVHCDIIASLDHPLPRVREQRWHDCTVVTVSRIESRPADIFAIVVGGGDGMPFVVSRCRVAAEGWEVEGKVLF